MKERAVYYVLFLFCFFLNEVSPIRAGKHKVLLLSFDGFRWDYVNHYLTPNLDLFKTEGASSPEGITSTFITKTYPSHYTMATGLHAESHGIINNVMYDPVFNASFSYDTLETRWWDGARPVWTSATLQGLKVGTYFWPGSSAVLDGVQPDRWKTYDSSVPFEIGIDTVMKWFTVDDLDFVVAYLSEPDSTGHNFGALSPQVAEKVTYMDDLFGYLNSKLRSANLYNYTDVILVSDHGMTNVTDDEEHVIVLSDYLDLEENIQAMPDEGALVNLLPLPGKEDTVYEKLHNAHPRMTVYRKENIPERFNYKNHRRILPIVLFADEGCFITKRRPYEFSRGQHGYDNALPSMRPIFFARGPSFKPGAQVPSSYRSVNVYPLVCHLLNIQPSPNNGSLEESREMLRDNGKMQVRSLSEADGQNNHGDHLTSRLDILGFLTILSFVSCT